MNSMALVSVFGVLAAISWGITDLYAAKSAKAIGPTMACLLVNILESIIFIFIYILFLHPTNDLTWTGFMYAALAGVFLSIGAAAFFRSLDIGPVSIVTPIANTYPLITAIIAILFFGAILSSFQLLGIVLVVIGIMLASGLLNKHKTKHKIAKGPIWAIFTAIWWAIGFALLSQAINHLGWQLTTLIEYIFVTLTFVALIPFIKRNEKISSKLIIKGASNKIILITVIMQLAGVMFLNIGLSKSSSSSATIIAISACAPIVTMFLALKIFKEKVSKTSLAGAFVGIVGVIILSIG